MSSIIFVYKKGDAYKVLDNEASSNEHQAERNSGWEHIATINSAMFLESILNKPEELINIKNEIL